jgi:hypothetical protein
MLEKAKESKSKNHHYRSSKSRTKNVIGRSTWQLIAINFSRVEINSSFFITKYFS